MVRTKGKSRANNVLITRQYAYFPQKISKGKVVRAVSGYSALEVVILSPGFEDRHCAFSR
jgi:hypothetical protein